MNISTKICRELAESIIDLSNHNNGEPTPPLTEDQLKYIEEQSKKPVYSKPQCKVGILPPEYKDKDNSGLYYVESKHGYLLKPKRVFDSNQPCKNCYEYSIVDYTDQKFHKQGFCACCKQEYIFD